MSVKHKAAAITPQGTGDAKLFLQDLKASRDSPAYQRDQDIVLYGQLDGFLVFVADAVFAIQQGSVDIGANELTVKHGTIVAEQGRVCIEV